MFDKYADKVSDISLQEVKYAKKAFDWMDKAHQLKLSKAHGLLSKKELKTFDKDYKSYVSLLGKTLVDLYSYGVDYNSFANVINDDILLDILSEAYDFYPYSYDKCKFYLFKIDKEPRTSEKTAKKDLKEAMKKVSNSASLIARLFLNDEVKYTSEQLIYKYRDWLINDFDALIEEIEPVRQEYILSRKGVVTPEDVDEYLRSKYDYFDLYNQALFGRSTLSFVYYPNLKI